MAQISKKLGQNIKRIRLRRKMTQGDICRKLDMDRSYMSAIEGGKKNITIDIEQDRRWLGRVSMPFQVQQKLDRTK